MIFRFVTLSFARRAKLIQVRNYICLSGTNIVAQIENQMLMQLDDNEAQETNYYDRCTLVPELAEQGSLLRVLLSNKIMHFKSNQTRYSFKPWRVD